MKSTDKRLIGREVKTPSGPMIINTAVLIENKNGFIINGNYVLSIKEALDILGPSVISLEEFKNTSKT